VTNNTTVKNLVIVASKQEVRDSVLQCYQCSWLRL